MKCERCKADIKFRRCPKCGYEMSEEKYNNIKAAEKAKVNNKKKLKKRVIRLIIFAIIMIFGISIFSQYVKSGNFAKDVAQHKENVAEKKEQKRIEKELKRERAEQLKLEKEAAAKEEAKRKAEERAKMEAEAKVRAEKEAEEQARYEAEARVKAELEAEERAKIEAEKKAEEEKRRAEEEKIRAEEEKAEAERRKQEELSKKYKIGKYGEGGGIIFYDKGEYSDGWRFLEASTTDVGYSYWCPKQYREGYISGLMNGLGNGYENTQIIIDEFGPESAAGIANSYHNKGFDDWYLPNRAEMALLYEVLGQKYYKKLKDVPGWAHVRGEGGFFDDNVFYWTSELAGAGNAYMVDCSGKHSGDITDSVMYDTEVILGLTATPIHNIRAIRRF